MYSSKQVYEAGLLERFAIDEVHCCSQWGHDFRPGTLRMYSTYMFVSSHTYHVFSQCSCVYVDYKDLGMLRAQFPKVPILGLTATAGEHVLRDCLRILRIPDALVFRASFNRPNLFYEVPGSAIPFDEHLSALLSTEHSIFGINTVFILSRT